MVKRRDVVFPPGAWPPRMMAEMAAGYCGEKHVEDFLERVGSVYPAPRVVDSTRRKFWYRDDLDRAIGLGEPLSTLSIGERFVQKLRKQRSNKIEL